MNSNFCNTTKSIIYLNHHTHTYYHAHRLIKYPKYQNLKNTLCTNSEAVQGNKKSETTDKVPKYLPLKKFCFSSLIEVKVNDQQSSLIKYIKNQNIIRNIYEIKYLKMINKLLNKPEKQIYIKKRSPIDESINRVVDSCVQQMLQCFSKNTERSKQILKSKREKNITSSVSSSFVTGGAQNIPFGSKKYESVAAKKLTNPSKKWLKKSSDSSVNDTGNITKVLNKGNTAFCTCNFKGSMPSFYKPKQDSLTAEKNDAVKSESLTNISNCKCLKSKSTDVFQSISNDDKLQYLEMERKRNYEKKLQEIIKKIQRITGDVFLIKKQIDTLILDQQKEIIRNKIYAAKNKRSILDALEFYRNKDRNLLDDYKPYKKDNPFLDDGSMGMKLLDTTENKTKAGKNNADDLLFFKDIIQENPIIKKDHGLLAKSQNKMADKAIVNSIISQQSSSSKISGENREVKKHEINETKEEKSTVNNLILEEHKVQNQEDGENQDLRKCQNSSINNLILRDISSQTGPFIKDDGDGRVDMEEKNDLTDKIDTLYEKRQNWRNTIRELAKEEIDDSKISSKSTTSSTPDELGHQHYISDDPLIEMVRQNRRIDAYESLAKNRTYTAIFFHYKGDKRITIE